MKRQTNWIVVLVVIFALAGLACNAVTGGGDEPAAVVVTEGEPAATEAASAGGGESTGGGESAGGGEVVSSGQAAPTFNLGPENNFGVPSDLNSYRIAVDIQFEETKADGTVENGRITATGAQVVEPFASTFEFTVEGSDVDLEFGDNTILMTQIGDTSYVNFGGTGCLTTSGQEFDNPFDEFVNSESFLGGLEGATLVEENVTINGIQTTHYQFDETSVKNSQETIGELQNAEGHIYISREEGYLVRLSLEADGQNLSMGEGEDGTGEGHIVYQIDYSDFNQPIEITEPEGCGASDSEFPLLPDAVDVNSFGDVLTYNTSTGFEDAVAFYKTEMVAAGYTLESEFASDPTALLSFEKEGETVSVSVIDNPSGDGLSVVISKG